MKQSFIIHTDGGSRGNPGPAAIGVVISAEADSERGRTSKNLRGSTSGIESSGQKWEYGEFIGVTTNNVAEYQAVIFAFKKLKQLAGSADAEKSEIVFYLDSELLVKQLNHQYKVKDENMQKLFMEVHNLRLDFGKVEFKHVLRGKNTDADRMVNQVLDREANKLDL